MKTYKVHRALYKQYLAAGVPMFFLIIEIVVATVFLLSGIYWGIALIIPIHIIVAKIHKDDPYFFYILMDVVSMQTREKKK